MPSTIGRLETSSANEENVLIGADVDTNNRGAFDTTVFVIALLESLHGAISLYSGDAIAVLDVNANRDLEIVAILDHLLVLEVTKSSRADVGALGHHLFRRGRRVFRLVPLFGLRSVDSDCGRVRASPPGRQSRLLKAEKNVKKVFLVYLARPH